MKTLASFKRALQPGTKWETFYVPSGKNLGESEVCILQTNAVAFMREGKLSWLQFPKASEYDFIDGEVHIYWPPSLAHKSRVLVLKYKKID